MLHQWQSPGHWHCHPGSGFQVFYQGTGNGKSLFLAAGKVFTVLFQHKIKLSRFTLYYLFSLCCGKCPPQILVRGIFPAPFQIVPDRAFEKSCLLGNNADSGAEITSGVILNILTIQQNGSFAGIIESGNQIYQSGFPLPVPPIIPTVCPFLQKN